MDNLKTLIPLFVGVFMIGVAVVGAAFNMLAPAPPQPVVVHANKVEQKKKEKKRRYTISDK